MGVVLMFLLLALQMVSAATSSGYDHRYKGPYSESSTSYYFESDNNLNDGSGYYTYPRGYRYPNQRYATVPIFKGSYGNYRYQMYANGDFKPSVLFQNYYPGFGYGGFGGGFGGYGGGFGGYGKHTVCIWWRLSL